MPTTPITQKVHRCCPYCKSTDGFHRTHQAVLVEEYSFRNTEGGGKWGVLRALADSLYASVDVRQSHTTVVCVACHKRFRFSPEAQQVAAESQSKN